MKSEQVIDFTSCPRNVDPREQYQWIRARLHPSDRPEVAARILKEGHRLPVGDIEIVRCPVPKPNVDDPCNLVFFTKALTPRARQAFESVGTVVKDHGGNNDIS